MARKGDEDAMVIDRADTGYDETKLVGVDGRTVRSTNNGDAIARAMFGMDRAQVNACLREHGHTKWVRSSGDLNNGQHRMLAGNKLRAMVRKGEVVRIGGFTIRELDQIKPTAEQAYRAHNPD